MTDNILINPLTIKSKTSILTVLNMEKKNVISSFLLIALIISGVSNIIIFNNISQEDPTDFSTFRRQIYSSFSSIEPLNSTDSISKDVVHQVCEGLFTYDLRDISLPRINHLAEDYFWKNQTMLQVKVREGVLFHDGYPFNASAVKWNLDRINYLINATRTLSSDLKLPLSASLFFLQDGITPIINRTVVETELNVSIYLNSPFSPFLNLLCHQASSMLSPKSTPATRLIQLNEDLIGTGPFIFDSCTQDDSSKEAVHFSRWDGYWRNLPHFEKMIFGTFEYFGCTYFGQCEIDWYHFINLWLDSWLPDNLKFKSFTDDTGLPKLTYQYLGFNNKVYNATWRKVMCLAFNYSNVLDVIRLGNGIRAKSPISASFGAAYNISVQNSYNITKARNIMQSMGFGTGFTTDAEWISIAESISPFLSIPYTYNLGNQFREDLFTAVHIWFKLIGIEVQDDGVTFAEYLNYLYDDRDHLGIYSVGFVPDYLDPYNTLDKLFNPNSDLNFAQVDDPWVNSKLLLALNTPDEATRNNIYKDIQWYLTEVGCFHAPLYHPKITVLHSAKIYNTPYNALDLFEAYYMYRI
ncbi:MAG: ABC transporter substrate-binding protein [Candidatus Lokiarchaeota archaeon]|nr:ABC transporter substrate-binding protein [Candidatus Lokiarchaeota archaeon]